MRYKGAFLPTGAHVWPTPKFKWRSKFLWSLNIFLTDNQCQGGSIGKISNILVAPWKTNGLGRGRLGSPRSLTTRCCLGRSSQQAFGYRLSLRNSSYSKGTLASPLLGLDSNKRARLFPAKKNLRWFSPTPLYCSTDWSLSAFFQSFLTN